VRLRQISAAHPRWGWRKAYWVLRSQGLVVNHKRVRSYWCDEGLKRPARARKKQRIGPQRWQATDWLPQRPTTCGRWTSRSTSHHGRAIDTETFGRLPLGRLLPQDLNEDLVPLRGRQPLPRPVSRLRFCHHFLPPER